MPTIRRPYEQPEIKVFVRSIPTNGFLDEVRTEYELKVGDRVVIARNMQESRFGGHNSGDLAIGQLLVVTGIRPYQDYHCIKALHGRANLTYSFEASDLYFAG